jgi:hypothetical protein
MLLRNFWVCNAVKGGIHEQLTTFFSITKQMFAAFYFNRSRSRVDKRSLKLTLLDKGSPWRVHKALSRYLHIIKFNGTHCFLSLYETQLQFLWGLSGCVSFTYFGKTIVSFIHFRSDVLNQGQVFFCSTRSLQNHRPKLYTLFSCWKIIVHYSTFNFKLLQILYLFP